MPGGQLVFSVEHPIYTAPRKPGWVGGAWPLDAYLEEGPRTTNWLADGVVKRHRTVASYVNLLIRSGFELAQLVEWGPSEAQLSEHPEWALERERPAFLLVRCTR